MKEKESCAYCGKQAERKFLFVCPSCGRDGCSECIPAGKGCECPECEEGDSGEEVEE